MKITNKSFFGGPLYYEAKYKIEGLDEKRIEDELGISLHGGGPAWPNYEQDQILPKLKKYCWDHGIPFETEGFDFENYSNKHGQQ